MFTIDKSRTSSTMSAMTFAAWCNKEARRLEDEGHRIIKLNIGNPAPFGFGSNRRRSSDVILNMPQSQGYRDPKGSSRPQGGDAVLPAKGCAGSTSTTSYRQRREQRAHRDGVRRRCSTTATMLGPSPTTHLDRGRHLRWSCGALPLRRRGRLVSGSDDIRACITLRTRGLVLINPNNPTGAVYGSEFCFEAIGLARQHNLIIFADEIATRSSTTTSPTPASAPVRRRDGGDLQRPSKAYRAWGFRQGWMVITIPKAVPRAISRGWRCWPPCGSVPTCPCSTPSRPPLGGCLSINELILPGPPASPAGQSLGALNEIPGVSASALGALYMFPRLDPKVYDIRDDQKMVFDLRSRRFCWCKAPASTAGADHFRLVFLPEEELKRLSAALPASLNRAKQ